MVNWKCALGVTYTGLNDPLEDLGAATKNGDRSVTVGIEMVFVFWDGSYTSTHAVNGEMGVEEEVDDYCLEHNFL